MARRDISEFIATDYEFASCRVPTSDLQTLQLLLKSGFFLVDTLVYYKTSTEKHSHEDTGATSCIEQKHLIDQVVDTAKLSFNGYPSHYAMDPRLNRDRAAEIYIDWAKRCCTDKEVATDVRVLLDNSKVAAFVALKKYTSHGEVLLAAVLPSHQGRGMLQRLLRSTVAWGKEMGISEVYYSTQIQNISAQKALTRQGWEISHSFYTLHCWRDDIKIIEQL